MRGATIRSLVLLSKLFEVDRTDNPPHKTGLIKVHGGASLVETVPDKPGIASSFVAAEIHVLCSCR
jgi:hypothetical protein